MIYTINSHDTHNPNSLPLLLVIYRILTHDEHNQPPNLHSQNSWSKQLRIERVRNQRAFQH